MRTPIDAVVGCSTLVSRAHSALVDVDDDDVGVVVDDDDDAQTCSSPGALARFRSGECVSALSELTLRVFKKTNR